jgi:predicted aconitase
MKVMEKVPYIKGMEQWLGTELNDENCAYLKDFGAATASNGAVGLYHIANLTPEAKELGESLIREGAPTYVIDDAELERVKAATPASGRIPTPRRSCASSAAPISPWSSCGTGRTRCEAA